jgi:von Willebrand factor type A domain-containing protein
MRYLWYSMYAFATALALYALFFRGPSHQPAPRPEPVAVEEAPQIQTFEQDVDVQIALILDTSSSMDGLVEQARTQVWEMVSEMQVDEDGKERTVAVSLYQYGNSRLAKDQGFIEQLTPLTTDLDHVTVKLYALRTSGGKEYAPLAIKRAVEELEWETDDSVQKLIVIAGNEGFGQGPVSPGDAFAHAAKNDIAVLPIYCANQGASKTAISSWRDAATLAGAEFDSIDPDQQIAKIESPFDAEILRKYRELEEAKVYAAGQGQSAYCREAESYLDGSVAVDRAVVQSRVDSSADLVNAYDKPGFDALSPAAMPEDLRGKSKDEQREYLAEKQARQQELKNEITELNDKRRQHIQKRMKEIPAYQSRKSSLGTSFRKNAKETLKKY